MSEFFDKQNDEKIISPMKLYRQTSEPIKRSNNNLDELASFTELLSIKRQISEPIRDLNMSKTIHQGYSKKKNYTEDASCFVNLGRYKFLICADGHGGSHCSKYATTRAYQLCFQFTEEKIVKPIEQLLKDIVVIIHEEIYKNYTSTISRKSDGCTFVMVCVDTLTHKACVANLGDSKCVIVRDGTILFETEDMCCDNPKEFERINKTQYSKVIKDQYGCNRLNGILMTSAGFGDFHLTCCGEDPVRRNPDISIVDLQVDDVIIVSSDGLFEKINEHGNGLTAGKRTSILADDVRKSLLNQNTNLSLSDKLLEYHIQFLVEEYYRINDKGKMYSTQSVRECIESSFDNMSILTYIYNKI